MKLFLLVLVGLVVGVFAVIFSSYLVLFYSISSRYDTFVFSAFIVALCVFGLINMGITRLLTKLQPRGYKYWGLILITPSLLSSLLWISQINSFTGFDFVGTTPFILTFIASLLFVYGAGFIGTLNINKKYISFSALKETGL